MYHYLQNNISQQPLAAVLAKKKSNKNAVERVADNY